MAVDTTDPIQTFLDSDVGVTIFDTDFQLVAWNKHYAHMGLTPSEDVKFGQHLVDIYAMASRKGIFGPGDPDQLAEDRFQDARSGKSPRRELFDNPNGGRVLVRRFFLPNIGVAAILTDATKLENELRVQQRKSALNLINSINKECQHQFNNQLSTILANIEFAKLTGDMTFLDKAAKFAFDDARKFLRHAGEQLLDVGKAIKQVAHCFQVMSANNITFRSNISLGRCGINANPKEFFCCLLNLLFNSQEAIGSDDGEIRLEAKKDAHQSNQIRITVSDTRAKKAIQNDLGWEEIDDFVESADGTIDISLENGTCVGMNLPIHNTAQTTPSLMLSPNQRSTMSGLRVLLVEDEPNLAIAAQSVLTSIGYETVTVNSGTEAKRLIDLIGDHFDIVLSDFRLKGSISGVDVLRYCRQHYPNLPAILATATPQDCNTREFPVLEKPVQWQVFEELVRMQLNQIRSRTA